MARENAEGGIVAAVIRPWAVITNAIQMARPGIKLRSSSRQIVAFREAYHEHRYVAISALDRSAAALGPPVSSE